MGIFKSTYLRYMDQKGIKYTDRDERIVRVVYSGEKLSTIPINVIFDSNNDSRATFDCYEIAKFPENKFANGLILCNSLNSKYRWVKFYIDSDKDLRCQADAILSLDSAGAECAELVSRMVNIIDESYPDIMKSIW